jgi:K(+)-stimulated pyrophosphate-energized sodium pump
MPGNHFGRESRDIILFSLVGIFGSYSVSWFGIRINTFANSRAALGRWRASRIRATPFRSRRA